MDMTPSRRRLLQLGAGAAVLAAPRLAQSQNWPARPVRIIVGLAPGGGTDIVARLTAQWLSDRLGQPFVVENRPGANGNIATEAVVNAPPTATRRWPLVRGPPTTPRSSN